jgi:hypothetical protein
LGPGHMHTQAMAGVCVFLSVWGVGGGLEARITHRCHPRIAPDARQRCCGHGMRTGAEDWTATWGGWAVGLASNSRYPRAQRRPGSWTEVHQAPCHHHHHHHHHHHQRYCLRCLCCYRCPRRSWSRPVDRACGPGFQRRRHWVVPRQRCPGPRPCRSPRPPWGTCQHAARGPGHPPGQ